MTTEKVRAELQLKKIRYRRKSESVKHVNNEMKKLIKSNFIEKNIARRLNNAKQESLIPYNNFQRKSNCLDKTGH